MFVDNLEERLKYHDAFWKMEPMDRCVMAVTSSGKYSQDILKYYQPPDLNDKEDVWDFWTNPERVFSRELERMKNTYFAGDAVPIAAINLGPCCWSSFFEGAKYQFSDTLWLDPSIEDIEDPIPQLDFQGVMYRVACEMRDYYIAHQDGTFMIGNPDNSGVTDCLANLIGTENLLMDMVAEPEAVKLALAKIQTEWEKLSPDFVKPILKANNGYTSIGWLSTCTKGISLQMQLDTSVMLSPDMVRDFCIPELIAQCKKIEHPLYHLDGIEQTRFIDQLLEIKGIETIQWTSVAGQPSPLECIPWLRKIQKAGKRLLLPHIKPSEAEGLISQLSSKGLMLVTETDTPEEADALVRMAKEKARFDL